MRLILPVGILASAVTLYTWLWFANAERMEDQLSDWVRDQKAQGVDVSHGAVSFSGFPFRLEMSVAEPRLTVEVHGETWTVETGGVSLHTLPYKMAHVIAEATGAHRVTIARGAEVERFAGTAEAVRIGLVWDNFALERVTVDVAGFDGTREAADGTTAVALADGTINMHRKAARNGQRQDHEYDLAAALEGVRYGGHSMPGLSEDIRSVKARLTVSHVPAGGLTMLATSPDAVLRQWRDGQGTLDIETLTVDWAPVRFGVSGSLGLDANARLLGKVDLRIAGHDQFLDVLETSGAINGNMATASRRVFDFVASISKADDGGITVPVNMEDGKILLGPAKIGELNAVVKNDQGGTEE